MTAAPNGRLVVDDDGSDGRYHRQTLISWWEQERLASAKVLVVGAGALGNELIKNLALLGVGTIIVIDLDAVENSNLSRCVLFRETDEGRPKAHVVAAAAGALNPEVDVIPVVGDVRTAFGLRVFAEVDLVLGGLDNREARLYVNECCWKTSTPWIDGAIEGLLGTMRVFVPPDSACYECTMSERDHELIAAHARADDRGQGAHDRDVGEHHRRPTGPGGREAAALRPADDELRGPRRGLQRDHPRLLQRHVSAAR
jgi:hypothetical protein